MSDKKKKENKTRESSRFEPSFNDYTMFEVPRTSFATGQSKKDRERRHKRLQEIRALARTDIKAREYFNKINKKKKVHPEDIRSYERVYGKGSWARTFDSYGRKLDEKVKRR